MPGELDFARMFRRSCDGCGAPVPPENWGSVGSGTTSARTEGQRAAAAELIGQGWGTAWNFWWCAECENCGAFEPLESDMNFPA